MGASLSSDVYQYKVDAHLDKISNCMAIADDIIMNGYREDGKDHDKTVREVLDKAKAVGMRFNPSKCQFRKTQVKFFGLILSRQGVLPDPAKIEALKRLPEPRDEKLLQSFLGMVNYLSRFDPNIVNLTHNLRELLKKGTDPKWRDVHILDFKRIIETLVPRGENPQILQAQFRSYFWKQMPVVKELGWCFSRAKMIIETTCIQLHMVVKH